MNRIPFLAATALVAGLLAPPAAAQMRSSPSPNAPAVEGPAGEANLDAVRRATEKYRDIEVALADGYVRDPSNMCVTAPMEGQPKQLGAMGIHFFRPDLLGLSATDPRVAGAGTHTDFLQPGVLIYEPRADGTLELVAVENLVFREAWHELGSTEAPSYLGNEYYAMIDNPSTPEIDEAHHFEPHYELHVWLYRNNPNGMFAPFNPDVTCEHHRPDEAHPRH